MSFIRSVVLSTCAVGVAQAFNLYAYGTGISGLEVWSGDDLMYIGTTVPSTISEAADVTFAKSSDEVLVTSDSWDATKYLYLNDSAYAFAQLGFTSDASTLSDDEEITDWGWYGAWLYHLSDSDTIETSFYATPTEDDSSVYAINWKGAEGTATGTSVALRTVGPS